MPLVDISQFPYYSYDEHIHRLMKPLYLEENIRFVTFRRCFSSFTQTFIINSFYRDTMIDYYKKGYYKTIYRVKDIECYESSFLMWDHFNFGPYQKSYEYLRNQHNLYHGLTIIQQHGVYCDFFLFATHDRNATINNFYLNNKELFLEFLEKFYEELNEIIADVSRCRIVLPIKKTESADAHKLFSPRQLECGRLVTKGLTSKEIARELKLSPRTVEDYIHILKKKSGAKNRAQLVYYLSGMAL